MADRSRAQILELQSRLKAAGFNVELDGREGPATLQAEAAYTQAQQAQKDHAAQAQAAAETAKAAAAQAKADSDARAAQSQAEAAKATAEAATAQAAAQSHAADLDLQAKQLEAAHDPMERAYQVGLNVAAPLAGLYAGHKMADAMMAKHMASLKAKSAQIAKLGVTSEKVMEQVAKAGGMGGRLTARAAGIVATAEKLALGTIRGPMGLATAGILLAEGAMARFVIAPSTPNPNAQDALRAAGTASAFAATALVGQRLVQNATVAKLPQAVHFASIEQVRALVAANASKVPGGANVAATVSKASRVAGVGLKVLGRAAVPLAILSSAVDAYKGYQKDGIAGAVKNVVTLGFWADSAPAAAPGPQASAAPATPVNPTVRAARIALGRAAAQRAAVEQRTPEFGAGPDSLPPGAGGPQSHAAAAKPVSDGHVADYFRMQDGKSVHVTGYQRQLTGPR